MAASKQQDQEEEAESPQLQPGDDGWTDNHDAGYQLGLQHAAASAAQAGQGGGVSAGGGRLPAVANLPRATASPRPTLGTELTPLSTSALNVSRTNVNPNGVADALPAPTTTPFTVAQINPMGLPRTPGSIGPAVGGTVAVPTPGGLPRNRIQRAVTADPADFWK